jgi:hypothetical protein
MSSLSPEPELPLPPLPPPSPFSKTDFASLNLPPDPHGDYRPTHLLPISNTYTASEPTTPTTPSVTDGSEGKQKRNPLLDLVETEKTFVEQLTGIIRAGSN